MIVLNYRVVLCLPLLLFCLLEYSGNVYAQSQDNIGNKAVKQDSTLEKGKAVQRAYEQLNQFESRPVNSAALEIDGLIVDETITKIGRDFYDLFHRQWEAPPMVKDFSILIKELPTRGNGALVQINVNDVIIFEQQLQPRYDIIEEVANYAVAYVYEHLVNDQLRQQLEADGKKSIEQF